MGLIDKLGEQVKQSMLLVPLLAILTSGCGAHRQLNMEEVFPKIRSLDTTVYCQPVFTKTPEGILWKTMFYGWFTNFLKREKPEPEWTLWYSQHKDRKEAVKDCKDFYELANERWRDYLRTQPNGILPTIQCTAQHEQFNLEEVFPKTDPPPFAFSCRAEPVKISGVNNHWRAMSYAWYIRPPKNLNWSFLLLCVKSMKKLIEIAASFIIYLKKDGIITKNRILIYLKMANFLLKICQNQLLLIKTSHKM